MFNFTGRIDLHARELLLKREISSVMTQAFKNFKSRREYPTKKFTMNFSTKLPHSFKLSGPITFKSTPHAKHFSRT